MCLKKNVLSNTIGSTSRQPGTYTSNASLPPGIYHSPAHPSIYHTGHHGVIKPWQQPALWPDNTCACMCVCTKNKKPTRKTPPIDILTTSLTSLIRYAPQDSAMCLRVSSGTI